MRVVGIVASFVPRGLSIQGKFILSSPRGVNGHRRLVPDVPNSGTPRERQAKVRDVTVLGLYKAPVGTGHADSVFDGTGPSVSSWYC